VNTSIRNAGAVVIAMFLALFVGATTIQVVQADELRGYPYNTRTLLASYDVERGPILVEGSPIVRSVPTDTETHYQRVYESGPLYAHVTGYFTHTQGSTGIEGAMMQELSGTSDSQFFDEMEALFTGRKPAGAAVELTINDKAQRAAWDGLGDLKGAVVAMDPKTGAVLAMVSKPTFDPNELAVPDTEQMRAKYEELLEDPEDPFINRAITGNLNPPGSVFKIVVAAAALENGLATPDSPLPNPATYTLPGTSAVVNNPNWGEPCGPGDTTTLRTAIEFSCNIPFADLAVKLGSDRIRAQAEKFGFNNAFQIPLAVTASAYPKDALDPAQTALTGFGQYDVRATPIQMAMISSAIANDGVVMRPQLVNQVLSPSLNQLKGLSKSEFGRAVSPQNAQFIREMMVASVNNGVASNARMDGVEVAGKTGTAENGPDEPYSLWFTGFTGTEGRTVAVAVVLEDGGGMGQSGTGNGQAALIANQVMKAVLEQ